jgi:hypothetical protein
VGELEISHSRDRNATGDTALTRCLRRGYRGIGHYARMARHRDEAGLPIGGFDAQIAAICRAHGAALATRNIKDFLETGVEVIDPWRSR